MKTHPGTSIPIDRKNNEQNARHFNVEPPPGTFRNPIVIDGLCQCEECRQECEASEGEDRGELRDDGRSDGHGESYAERNA